MSDPQRELEHLRKLATANPHKRFGKLLKIVRQETFLTWTWECVRTNPGSRTPGIDGQTKEDIDHATLRALAQELVENRYGPKPARRVYIPKGKHQQRGLGIPTLRDRIVQAAVAQVLAALYEPLFRQCSYGFRPGRSPLHALRHLTWAYRTGATWVLEGDLVKCFDRLPHSVILTCLRKRIKDERFIDLIRRMLKAGVMEDFRYQRTYSGTPQGGPASPILANIVLHELDCWMEDHWHANAPPPHTRENPEYARIKRNLYRWGAQLHGRLPMGRQTSEGLRRKVQEAKARRKYVPCYEPRQAIYFCRYADDYAVVLCGYAKADAQCLKQAMAEWLQTQLGLTQHPAKTRITHWSEPLRFLGYDLQGQRNPNGTRWLRLAIPPEVERDLKQRVKRLCGYTQVPALDLFVNVNALMRGWTQYYSYAHNATRRFRSLLRVVFWLTAHYLGRKQRCSIKSLMAPHYGVDPQTGRRALYVTRPDGQPLFIWNTPPRRRPILTRQIYAQDRLPVLWTAWARGHSYEQRLELLTRYGKRCQRCGQASPTLVVHHPHRLSKRPYRKRGPVAVIQSAQEQQAKLLCPGCHLQHHHGRWNDGATA